MLKLSMFVDEELPKEVMNAYWPNLNENNARNTSEYDTFYNCFGYALGFFEDDNKQWWWPIKRYGVTWPNEYPYVNTLPNVLKMLKEKFNYEKCVSGDVEEQCEKIAIFCENEVTPKHYAKQLPNGKWRSKIGQAEDIEHDTLEALLGNNYGQTVTLVKRKLPVIQ